MDTFHHELHSPVVFNHAPSLTSTALAARENIGVLDCYGYPVPPRVAGIGAIGTEESGYAGEAYAADASGTPSPGSATVVAWRPNAATVRPTQPRAGELLVYNMSFDFGLVRERASSD